MDNLRFALNMNNYIPEHIIYELRSEQEFLNEDVELKDTNELNSNVGQIFSKSKSKLELKLTYNSYKQKQIPFKDIIGYEAELLTKCLVICYQVRQHLLRLYFCCQYKKKFQIPVS